MSSTIASSILNSLSTSTNKIHLDVHTCQMQLQQYIEIEYEICNKNQTIDKFEKFNLIYKKVQYLSQYMFRRMFV